jgi:hypothetical protein
VPKMWKMLPAGLIDYGVLGENFSHWEVKKL